MTENRRIFWNIVATYGRSLYALVCGLFTTRWVLAILGQSDYGLLGVVGGLGAFITFVNGELAFANSRFYAVSIGEAKACASAKEGLENCRRWFNTALSIHLVVPVCLMIVGYPIGIWAIKHFLTIPPDRVVSCIWVFRFTCCSCLVGMMLVPFNAMYAAKQYIAELTIYSYVTITLNFGVVYYMLVHPGDWLAGYSAWMCIMAVAPLLIIAARACLIFPECKVVGGYLWDVKRIKRVSAFAGWHALGALCSLLRVNGVSILINKSFGSIVNAAMTIGSSVNGHAATMGNALRGAFSPAIMNAYGEGGQEKVVELTLRSCKFGSLLNLVFMIPLVVELPYVLKLWLKTPPEHAVSFCVSALSCEVLDALARGHCAAVDASGRIAEYHKNMTVISILTLPLAILLTWMGAGVCGIAVLLPVVRLSIVVRRVYFAKLFANMPIGRWIREVCFPIIGVMVIGLGAGLVLSAFLQASFQRLLLSIVVSVTVLLTFAWMMVLTSCEREFVKEKAVIYLRRMGVMS